MAFLKVFRQNYIDSLIRQLSGGRGYELYDLGEPIPFEETDVLTNNKITILEDVALNIPDENKKYDFENAVLIYEYLKDLDPTIASDTRLWTYLSHVPFWDYTKKRWPTRDSGAHNTGEHILTHWFIRDLNARSIADHGIARLWWGAYMTYDENREDKYELTRELFSMLDYTRTLFEGSLGRNKNFFHAFLEYTIENKDLFKKYKEGKIRSFMRKMNFVAGYNAITSLSIEEIKKNISKYEDKVIVEYPS